MERQLYIDLSSGDAVWTVGMNYETESVSGMKFTEFCKIYSRDKGPRLKESTWAFKRAVMNTALLPYFGKMALQDITPQDVIRWQNELMAYRNEKGQPYSQDYLRDVHAQLSAILNHAVRYYGLERNAAAVVGTFEKGAPREMLYWTKDEYASFAGQMKQYPDYYYAFEMLYWTGMREGELLALTPADLDIPNKTVTVSKTYHRIGQEDVITSPKTAKSNRTISMPVFLCDEMEDYMKRMHREMMLSEGQGSGTDPFEESKWQNSRLFPMSSYHLRTALIKGADLAGVKHIRVHDLRHSHVSLLINNGFSALAIGERVGHEAEKITYRYAHLFASVQDQMADMLDTVHAH